MKFVITIPGYLATAAILGVACMICALHGNALENKPLVTPSGRFANLSAAGRWYTAGVILGLPGMISFALGIARLVQYFLPKRREPRGFPLD